MEGTSTPDAGIADIPIPDGDYVLTDGCAWFTTGKFAIRIFTGKTHVVVQVYDDAAKRIGVVSQMPLQELIAYEE